MGTNYYFRNKEEYNNRKTIMDVRNKMINNIMTTLESWNAAGENLYDIQFRIENVANVGYEEIHIGKRSSGWKPLFRKQDQYSNVDQLQEFYESNSEEYEIVDEYGAVHTWDELKNELIDWSGERENRSADIYDLKIYKDEKGYSWADYEFS